MLNICSSKNIVEIWLLNFVCITLFFTCVPRKKDVFLSKVNSTITEYFVPAFTRAVQRLQQWSVTTANLASVPISKPSKTWDNLIVHMFQRPFRWCQRVRLSRMKVRYHEGSNQRTEWYERQMRGYWMYDIATRSKMASSDSVGSEGL